MTVGYGQLGHMRWNLQDSFGQVFVSSLEAQPIVDESLVETIGQLVEGGQYARHMAGPTHEGPRAVAGSISFEPLPDQLGLFLRAVTGASSDATFVDSAIAHKFRPLHNSDYLELSAMPPMTIVMHRDVGSADAYADMNLTQITFEMANSELLKASAQFVGGVRQNIAAVAPVFPAGIPWIWDQGSLSIGGVGITEFRSLTWVQNNNIEPAYTITASKTPSHFRRGGLVEVNVTGTLLADTVVHSHLFSIFQAQTEAQLMINFDAVSSPGSFLMDLPQARITEYTWNITGPTQIEIGITLVGKFDTTSTYMCEYTLTNCRVGYP